MDAAPSNPENKSFFEGLAALWLFPGLIIFTVLGNQPWETVVLISQIVAWVNTLAALFILWRAIRHKLWVAILALCIVGTKGMRVVTTSGAADIAYLVFLNILFCSAGAYLAFRKPNLVYRQLMVICLLNLIFMVLQTGGAGAWTQLLTVHGEGNLAQPASTLFVPENVVDYLIVQGRPAGLSYSNIILSLFLLFALALHFSRTRDRVWWGTMVLCAMMAFAMAKVVFFGFILIFLWVSITGDRPRRIEMIKALALTIAFIGLYYILFPGLAETNLSDETITASIFFRANDIVRSLSPGSDVQDVLGEYVKGTSSANWLEEGEHVSGYAQIIKHLDLLIPAFIAGTLAFLYGLRKLKRRFPTLTTSVVLTSLVLGMYPVAFPIWGLQTYWFMFGFGLLPFFYLLKPQFMREAKD